MAPVTSAFSQSVSPRVPLVSSIRPSRRFGGRSPSPILLLPGTSTLSAPPPHTWTALRVSPRRSAHATAFNGEAWGECSEEEVLSISARWVDKHIIGLELCPFAAPARRATRFRVGNALSVVDFLQEFSEELQLLANTLHEKQAATTLLILPPKAAGDWYVFMEEYFSAAEEEVARAQLSNSIQLVPFHPESTYSDHPDDCADYALRSPFPTIHLLRQRDVDAAEEEWSKVGKHTADVAEKNAAMLRGIGAEQLAAMMRNWFVANAL